MSTPNAAPVLLAGLTLCADDRIRDAEIVWGADQAEPEFLCIDCADRRIERETALGVSRGFVELLDRARQETVIRPLPVPPVDLETADRSKLEAIRRSYEAFKVSRAAETLEASRCFAMLPDGSRCARSHDGGEEGVCETHAYIGYRLPLQGWAGGEARGRVIARPGRRSAA